MPSTAHGRGVDRSGGGEHGSTVLVPWTGEGSPEIATGTHELLKQSGALLEGHFELSSGRHSPHYVQCARLLEEPRRAESVGASLASLVRTLSPDVVVGPALGGIVIAHEVARALGLRCLFTERQAGAMLLRRGFEFRPGERVLVVEDVITTGRSSLEVAAVVRQAGARVAGFACIVDRRGEDSPCDRDASDVGQSLVSDMLRTTETRLCDRDASHVGQSLDGAPLRRLVRIDLLTHPPGSCPLCRAGTPIDKPGSRVSR